MFALEDLHLMGWVAVHALCLGSAYFARLALSHSLGRHRSRHLLVALLPASLMVVALFAYLGNGGNGWIFSGATLGVMVMASVWDTDQESIDPSLSQVIASME